ncbi:hypothetical protein SmJEL517_g03808 [Synchytrium microbalum]|uniref:Protein kinase domain-containing protein n=1 Tax=Synchytrium microbalum TaxID=1806994 RepID=A0A507C0M1_9FUNG|nr:uncharacterized protein SmJEL517_g03808 [Synchytrium microbalum]TPX33232.1 hypothetical protein SmJEL517_g03808 [Synchytrium microbalum]
MFARKQLLGEYSVGKTIGQGAFSKVKLGIHKATGQKVAIKIINKVEMEKQNSPKQEKKPRKAPDADKPDEKPASPDKKKAKDTKRAESSSKKPSSFLSHLQAEVQLIMRLDHPNVIKIYQVLDTEEECFVVMEYASGGELVDLIASKGHLTEKEARFYFRQIISAMDHCHLNGVVHRDLKLENILLDAQRNALVSDFGLGRTFTSNRELLNTFCGTPNYAAIELITGTPYIGTRTDIWACGVILYIMLTGKPPFVGENVSALYAKIKAINYAIPDHFSTGK